jgi:hypothetical protein
MTILSKTVDEIILELEGLHLQQDRLRHQESRLVQQLRLARAIEAGHSSLSPAGHPGVVPHSGPSGFVKGLRVKVLNKNSPGASPQDKVGIITRLDGDRVYFTTISGMKTWRLRKNLLPMD